MSFPCSGGAASRGALDVFEISVVSYQGNRPVEPISAVFGPDGGSIGRGPGNTLVLPDPNRFVSRLQATVELEGGCMTIANASTANPLLVNARELEAGNKTALADGDELRIGLYVLRARLLAPALSHAAAADEVQQSRGVPPSCADMAAPLRATAAAASVSSPAAPTVSSPTVPASSALGTPPLSPPATPSRSSPGGAPLSPPTVSAGSEPLDPLALAFGGDGSDPFADLVPGGAASSRGEPAPSTGSALATPPLHGGRADAIDAAPAIPEHVWDDLAKFTTPSTPSEARTRSPLPASYDAFAAASQASRNPDDPFAEFAQNAVSLEALDSLDTPIDKLFADTGSPASGVNGVIPDPNEPVPDPVAGRTTVDPLALFGDNESPLRVPPDTPVARSESDQVPELEAYFRPPTPLFDAGTPAREDAEVSRAEVLGATDASPTPPRQNVSVAQAAIPPSTPAASMHVAITPSMAHTDHDDATPVAPAAPRPADRAALESALLDALLAGAGIANAPISDRLTPEFMKRVGAMLAVAVQGTIELIGARAMVKREVKADVTVIAPSRNNPLKFLPDAESALLQMFCSRIPGFMAPVEAMADAFNDLRAHEVGVIAGMHAALAQVLHRFSPDELEKRLAPGGMMESLLPSAHKARLWDSFTAMYGDISREAQDDFQSLFGKAFLSAYEAEVARLRGH